MTNANLTTILIVDDESYVLDMLRDQLSTFGYNIITASNGKKALQKAEELERIDILLTDMMMPAMNGIELAKKFYKSFPETKIIFMSGYVFPILNIKELPKENHTVFEKPFSLDRLNAEIARILTN